MEASISFNVVFNLLLTAAIGYISWSLKETYGRFERSNEKIERRIVKLEVKVDDNHKESLKTFITKDEHYRDLNALENKIDNIKDILMDIQKAIGTLTGERSRP